MILVIVLNHLIILVFNVIQLIVLNALQLPIHVRHVKMDIMFPLVLAHLVMPLVQLVMVLMLPTV